MQFVLISLDLIKIMSTPKSDDTYQLDVGYKSPKQESSIVPSKSTVKDSPTLHQLCNQYLADRIKDGWKLNDICNILLDTLQSSRSNEDIQSEVMQI